MGASDSKLRGILLPAQSGKTRKVQDEIKRFKLVDGFYGGNADINIIISANNKILVTQTATRMSKEMVYSIAESDDEQANDFINEKTYAWTSGAKKNNISSEALAWKICTGEITMVFVCAHKGRLTYVSKLLKMLNDHTPFAENKKVHIWIDEADATEKLWSKFPEVALLSIVAKTTLVSATFPKKMAQKYHITPVPYQVTHPDCYRGFKDCNVIKSDILANNAAEYVSEIILKYRDSIVVPGMRAFIPGDITKASHEEVADVLKGYGFNVAIINGERKEIRMKDGTSSIDLRPYLTMSADDSPEEFSTSLSRIYAQNPKLQAAPFAITGNVCIGRGVTFICAPKAGDHNGFVFDLGIVPPIADKCAAYQVMSRLYGNCGAFPSYQPPTIYTNNAMAKKVEEQEYIAINFARMIYEENIDGPMTVSMLAGPDNSDESNVNKTIPAVIDVSAEEIESLSVRSTKKERLMAILQRYDSVLYQTINTYSVGQMTTPTTDSSYKKHIEDVVKAALEGRKYIIDIKPIDKCKNIFNCYIDTRMNRLVFVIWNGENTE